MDDDGKKAVAPRRQILHLDLDAFYASVEQGDYPLLKGRPVIVGGGIERGVVAACSYEARAFGVRSAMAMVRALRLCPRAVVQPVRMERYREISDQVFSIFSRYTDRLEPLSIDEAFLDVTGCLRLFGPGEAIASRIRAEVRAETGLTVSAGVAPNKFLAKLASEAGKPDGLFVVEPESAEAFLLPLPVSRLWGVGAVTTDRLARLGLRTVADLRELGRERLVRLLGKAGEHLFALAQGIDDRPVETGETIKSVGHEETFMADLDDLETIRLETLELAERVGWRARRLGVAGRCITLKIRYGDFSTITRSRTFPAALDHGGEIYREALDLLERTEAGRRPVRLLGISLSQLEMPGEGQADLFMNRDRQAALDRAMDRVRERFGRLGVRRASLLGKEEEE